MSRPNALFAPVALGDLSLTNRLVMAPLTRSRASAGGVPAPSAALYYAQRAGAGLVVTEGVCISAQGVGNPGVPGLWDERQVRAWSEVTDTVHDAGGTVVAQLWHTGRAAHPSLQPDGAPQVGPSAVAIDGTTFARGGRVPHVVPRALQTEEIPGIVADYARAAQNARQAGFDGVEVHGANGYLVDQFLQDNANLRTDRYGGDVAGRTTFLAEVVDAVVGEVGAGRVGLRLSPSSRFQSMADSAPEALFEHVLELLSPLGLAYLHVVEPGISGSLTEARPADGIDSAWVRERYPGNLVAAGSYDAATAAAAVEAGTVDAVAFGRAFLANPDLPARFAAGAELNPPVRDTFYSGGATGYIDYPSLEALRLRSQIIGGALGPVGHGLTETTPWTEWELAWASEHARS